MRSVAPMMQTKRDTTRARSARRGREDQPGLSPASRPTPKDVVQIVADMEARLRAEW